jgi:hypothetical protein
MTEGSAAEGSAGGIRARPPLPPSREREWGSSTPAAAAVAGACSTKLDPRPPRAHALRRAEQRRDKEVIFCLPC